MLGFLTLETVKVSLYKRLDLFSLSAIQTDDDKFHYRFLTHKSVLGFVSLLFVVASGMFVWLVCWLVVCCLSEDLRLKPRDLDMAGK